MKKLLGFTLAELMVAMVVLGILLALVMPTITTRTANKNKMYIKKAYYTVTEVISILINDISLYPSIDGVCLDTGNSGYIGFDCYDDATAGQTKLVYNIAKLLNLTTNDIGTMAEFASNSNFSRSNTSDCNGVASSCYYFVTSDGIVWAFEKKAFTFGNPESFIKLGIDVNGSEAPNCYEGDSSCKNRVNGFDRFILKIFADGKIQVADGQPWAEDAIQIGSSLTER